MQLNFLGFITPNTSYGICSLEIVKSLFENDVEVSIFPLNNIYKEEELLIQKIYKEDTNLFVRGVQNSKLHFDINAPSIRLCHQNMLAEHVSRKLRIGFPIFECTKFKDDELQHLRSQDKLFVTSSWARDIILDNNISVPVDVVSLGVNRNIFNESVDPVIPKTKTTKFINIGKWEYRKGHDILIEAFNKAFTKNDDVQLVMMPHNFFLTKEEESYWLQKYYNSPLGNKINIIGRVETPEQVASVIASCDCGVFPYRAEGFCLPLLDCMSMGLHTIATNYSAPTQYIDEPTTNLIDVDDFEVANDNKWFKGNVGGWANLGESQLDQLIHHMRTIHKLKQNGLLTKNEVGIQKSLSYTWDQTTRWIKYHASERTS